jgi:hypothetical protein
MCMCAEALLIGSALYLQWRYLLRGWWPGYLQCAKILLFRAQADWALTHASHKDTEQSTIEASITLDGVTLTDSLIR